MIKKIYPLGAALCCLLFCFSVSLAQQRYWGINQLEYPTYVFHTNADQALLTKTYKSDDISAMGSYPDRIFRGADGAVYAINSYGGSANVDDLGYGTLLRITPNGIHKILQLSDYGDAYDFSLIDNQDGYLYAIGCAPGCFGSQLWKIAKDGSSIQKKRIVLYGLSPRSSPIKTSGGDIVGLSYGAGTSNRGMLYKILPDISGISILFSFSGPDGKAPRSNLLEGQDGFLYGTTAGGGSKNLGVIFRIKPDGTEFSVLHDYIGGTDGRSGDHLVQDADGYIYGDSPTGGLNKKGNIFRMRPDGTDYTSVFNFDGTTIAGTSFTGPLTLDSEGYFSLLRGPSTNSIYKVKKDGTGLTKIFDLPEGAYIHLMASDFAPANTAIISPTDNVPSAGTLVAGEIENALIYSLELSASSDFTSIAFSATSETPSFQYEGLNSSTTYYARVKTNAWPEYGATTSFTTEGAPKLWGITTMGGSHPCDDSWGGTIFSIDLDGGHFTKHYDNRCDYDTNEDHFLFRSLVHGDGNLLYGMTRNIMTATTGQILSIDQSGTVAEVYNNLGVSDGDFMQASNGMLYVTEPYSYAAPNESLLHKLNPDGSDSYSIFDYLHRFITKSGYDIFGAPIELEDGYLYGLAAHGGNFGRGALYKIRLDGTGFSVIHHFELPTGKNPKGSLILGTDGYLYGMTSSGGSLNYGAIFKVRPDGSNYTLLHSFNSLAGRFPEGDLTEVAGALYGMTYEGGAFKAGVLFKINTDGTNFTVLHHFNRATTGANPKGSLTAYQNYLYGMTLAGGANGLGVVFKIKSDGSGFTKLMDFSLETGGAPNGNLLLVDPSFGAPSTFARQEAPVVKAEKTTTELVRVFPNPTTRAFTVEWVDANVPSSRLNILDLQGKVVHESMLSSTQEIGAELPPGFYLLRITGTREPHVIRLIKK